MLIQDKVFVVTGGGDGIGRALVFNLLNRGAKVACIDINQNALDETKNLTKSFNDRISFHALDITDIEKVNLLPKQLIKAHGQVDGLINNAGIIHPFKHVEALEIPQIRKVFEVNFFGTLNMIKAFLPYLKERSVAHITNISSMGGFLPVPGQTIYGASKAAVKLLTEGLNSELKGTSIGVTVIFPGGVGTSIAKNAGIDIEKASQGKSYKVLTPEKAADLIIQATIKNKYRACVGNDSKFMDFIYRLNPKRAANFIRKQMASLLKD